MRKILISLNVLLLACLAYSSFLWIERSSGKKEVFSVKKRSDRKKNTAQDRKTTSEALKIKISDQDRLAYLKDHNVFDPSRCPNARVPGQRNNARVTMTLVGTFQIGKLSGAIILQKRQNNNRVPFMPPFMMGGMNGGNRFGGMGMNNNQGNQPRNSRNNQNNNRNNNSRQRFMPWMMGGMNPGQQTSTDENVVYQQYVRIGETLENGYKLTAITRTGATLTKGSEKLELTLQDASVNQNGKSNSANKTNQNRFGMMPFGGMPPPPPMMGGMGGMGNNNFQGPRFGNNGNNNGNNWNGRNRR